MNYLSKESDWNEYLREELVDTYFLDIISKLDEEYSSNNVFPSRNNLFNAFNTTNLKDLKVVILGQDPYHGVNQAHGLSFSVLDEKRPPSLNNMFKELLSDVGIERKNNDLSDWAEQGVFLLNCILSVREQSPASHDFIGWERFTDRVIEIISKNKEHVVFVLWGNYARSKKKFIDGDKHYIIESTHPSPFSAYRGFLGSKPYSKINNKLREWEEDEIKW